MAVRVMAPRSDLLGADCQSQRGRTPLYWTV
jgi:hypothetical protein